MEYLLTHESHSKKTRLDKKLRRLRDKILKWDEDNSKGRVDIVPQAQREEWQDEIDKIQSRTFESNDSLDALEHYQNTSSFAHNKMVDANLILDNQDFDSEEKIKRLNQVIKSYFEDLPSEPNLIDKIMNESINLSRSKS